MWRPTPQPWNKSCAIAAERLKPCAPSCCGAGRRCCAVNPPLQWTVRRTTVALAAVVTACHRHQARCTPAQSRHPSHLPTRRCSMFGVCHGWCHRPRPRVEQAPPPQQSVLEWGPGLVPAQPLSPASALALASAQPPRRRLSGSRCFFLQHLVRPPTGRHAVPTAMLMTTRSVTPIQTAAPAAAHKLETRTLARARGCFRGNLRRRRHRRRRRRRRRRDCHRRRNRSRRRKRHGNL